MCLRPVSSQEQSGTVRPFSPCLLAIRSRCNRSSLSFGYQFMIFAQEPGREKMGVVSLSPQPAIAQYSQQNGPL
jgi:hypothetical protein